MNLSATLSRGALVLAALCVLPMWGLAQKADSTFSKVYFESRIHFGFIIIHSRDIRAIENSYPWGVEMDVGWVKTTEKAWNSCLCTPRLGISLGFWDFDNRPILGQGVAAQFFIEPEFGTHNDLIFSFRAGLGLSYQNRPHHPVTNPDNLSYSTLFAFPLHVGCTLRWQFAERWQAYVSGRYNHISNGGLRQPNKGINWPTAAMGITWYPVAPLWIKHPKKPWRDVGKPLKHLRASIFASRFEKQDEYHGAIVGAELKYSKQVSRLNAISLGGEWTRHGGYDYRASQVGETAGRNMVGIALGHEFLLGRFIFSQQFGAYITKPENELRDVYQRYVISYILSEQVHIGFGFKAHGHVADFTDLRVAISL